MKGILLIGRGVEARRARVKEIWELSRSAMSVGVKAELIQALIPIGLWHAKELNYFPLPWKGYQRGFVLPKSLRCGFLS